MRLYHFTSRAHLRAINELGLTIGDVPTNIALNLGKVGVWLTTSPDPRGHGLEGGAYDKTEIRIEVELPDSVPLLRVWDEWASTNVTAETRKVLEQAGGASARTWHVYFGWIKREFLGEAVWMRSGEVIEYWDEFAGELRSLPGVPYWRKQVWHKQLLKQVEAFHQSRNLPAMGKTLSC